MVINTDTLTTLTGSVTSISGMLAMFGVLPQYTVPIAGASHALNSYFSKGISTKK